MKKLNDEKAELRELGASFFLQKPELKDLILILTFLLGGRQITADMKDVAKLFVKLAWTFLYAREFVFYI